MGDCFTSVGANAAIDTIDAQRKRIAELEAERDEAIAAALALKHTLDSPITPADIDRSVAECIALRPQMDAERRIAELEAQKICDEQHDPGSA